MKKILALVLALVLALMLLVSSACAEVTTCTFVSRTGLFTYAYPDGYIPLNADIMTEILADPEAQQELSDIGLNMEAFAALDFTTLEYLYAPDFIGNLNVNVTVGAGLSMDLLVLLQDTLMDTFRQQYAAMGISEDALMFCGFPVFGENSYFAYTLNYMGVTVEQYIICDNAGNMYYLSFTNFDEAAKDMVLSSFAFEG